jgi:4-carboxymuconolactone decarboxylase
VTDPAPPPRLPGLPRDEWGDDVMAALRRAFPPPVVDRFVADEPGAPVAIAAMLHHPALAGPWLEFNNVLLWSPALDDRARELMVLRVAWRTGSTYEWVQHVKLGERFGIGPNDVDAVRAGTQAPTWTELESALVAATDELLDGYRITEATWDRLAERLDERQLVEVVFVVGAYTCLAMAFESFGFAVEPEAMTEAALPLPPRPAS